MYAKFAGTIKLSCETMAELEEVSQLLQKHKIQHVIKRMVGFPTEPPKKKANTEKEYR